MRKKEVDMKHCLQLVSWSILLFLVFVLGCAHPLPQEELATVEGTVIAGGAIGVRIMTDRGKMMHFAAYRTAKYQPPDLCALHGDRIAVTYGIVHKSGESKLIATQVRLIRHRNDWGTLKSPVTGIIQNIAPLQRYRVRLDDLHLNIVVRPSPSANRHSLYAGGPFKVGDRVKLFLEEQSYHFRRKTLFTRLEMVQKGPLPVTNATVMGKVSEVLPGSFVLTLDDGTNRQFYRGTPTQYKDRTYERAMAIGDRVRIRYFNLLMGDRSVHPVASFIEKL
jgi:hypothetical protein